MHDIVSRGQALYWGTSEWPAERIREAIEVADRHHLHKPITEQSEYNLLDRERVEHEYAPLLADFGYGNTTFSPLAGGLLTGKYREGIPDDARAAVAGYEWFASRVDDRAIIDRIERVRPIARRLGCTMAQLALAWTTKHPMVSSVITGASRSSQVVENFAALDVIPLITDDVKAEIEAAIG
jgi:aryl-alcohol dehydrogenase-like predicted oxidoreductase